MRFIVCIIAFALTVPLEAAIRFTKPVWRPDLGLSLPGLAASTPEPVSLPRAASYLVTGGDGTLRLEDRYETFDLWYADTVRGRWRDEAGNRLTVMRLTTLPPDDPEGTSLTRRDAAARARALDPEKAAMRDEAVFSLLPFEVKEPVRLRRTQRRNMIDLWSYPAVDDAARTFVTAFRPRSPERGDVTDWYVAVLALAQTENQDEAWRAFDETFLDGVTVPTRAARPSPAFSPMTDGTEDARLREAVRRNVANYDAWHVTSADGVTVVDHLDEVSRGTFVSVLTNELPVFRRAYAASVPPALDGATNRTAVVRVFATREDYLAYVGAQHVWTAAIWDTLHRELVLWLPPDGTRELLRTVWHEAFHQYLAYAAALVPAAPWFNEGHAELFQHAQVTADGTLAFELDPEGADCARAVARSATAETVLAALMEMDYPEFYAEGRERAAFHYRLAWSMAYFLEVGAPQMRFRPFETVRAEYAQALVATRETRQADGRVWTAQRREAFISAWRDFWKRR